MKKGFCAHKKKFTGIIAVLLYRLTRGRIGGRHLLREETAALGGLYYINGPDVLPQPLSAAEETDALEALAAGSEAARTRLIEHNLRLVAFIARRYENSGVGIEDLISIGTPGLIKAVGTFRADRNIKLATYASRCIENEILMFFRNNRKNAQNVSIHDPIDTDKEGNALTLMDLIAVEDTISDDLSLKVESEKLHRIIRQVLDPRERQIIVLRYGLANSVPLPQRLVAKKLNISRSYVSRIEKRALAKLRAAMESK